MLRRITKGEKKIKDVIKSIQKIDAFPKVEESYVETSSFGGLVTLICWLGICLLLYSEINEFLQPSIEYKYKIDEESHKKLSINMDMTVAMPCNLIGADVLDVWGRDIGDTELVKEELVPFELAENQKMFLKLQGANRPKDVGSAFSSLEDMIGDITHNLVPRDDHGKDVPKDACRLYGSIPVNKVKGNFHILSGRSVNIAGMGHAHLQFGEVSKNFSHRIDSLTFGDRVHGMMYALDGEYKIAPTTEYSFQYFIQIVPTKYITEEMDVQTYQYTVQEQVRNVDHKEGHHGSPGIVMKYSFSPISAVVQVKERRPWIIFLSRLLGVVGGIISTSGLLNLIITECFGWICCCFKKHTNQAKAVS